MTLLAALGFSRGEKIPFHLPASASLLRVMDVFTTGSVMWHRLCRSLSLFLFHCCWIRRWRSILTHSCRDYRWWNLLGLDSFCCEFLTSSKQIHFVVNKNWFNPSNCSLHCWLFIHRFQTQVPIILLLNSFSQDTVSEGCWFFLCV